MTIVELQSLLHLLDRKLVDIENSKSKDVDTHLTHSILMFVKYLADKQLAIENLNQYSAQYGSLVSQTPMYVTSTIGNYSNTNIPSSVPSTICMNCWQKSNGKHTHCVHVMSSSLGEQDI
jgi:hypothetical protein